MNNRGKLATELLENYISDCLKAIQGIPGDRKEKLDKIAEFVVSQQDKGYKTEFIFICTHNSRRSHLSHIWAEVAAYFFEMENIACYSGGTEATAFNKRAVDSLTRAGFQITADDESNNPVYRVKYAQEYPYLQAFSKQYADYFNPQSGFAAVMTCSEADRNCPIVTGALKRFSLPYSDPKDADGTALEAESYDLRCRQIATEMFYIFSEAKRLLS